MKVGDYLYLKNKRVGQYPTDLRDDPLSRVWQCVFVGSPKGVRATTVFTTSEDFHSEPKSWWIRIEDFEVIDLKDYLRSLVK